MSRVMRILPVAAILFSSSIAAAQAPGQTLEQVQDDEPIAAPALQQETVSYRKQILVADGLSVAAIALGPVLARDTDSGGRLAMLGVAGYMFGAPLVHLAHGRGGAAFKSLGLRTALPMLGALAGFKLGPNDLVCAQSSESFDGGHGGGSCPGGSISGAIGGLLIGSIAAAAIDAKYLAHYETMRTAPTWSASMQPVRGGGMTVGVSGGF
jgi:hypothetical protein